jgi:hypothetical protein
MILRVSSANDLPMPLVVTRLTPWICASYLLTKSKIPSPNVAPYLWPIDGSNYDHTGRYSKRFITRDGCDSTYTLVLDIRPQHLFVDTVITNQDYLWDVNNTTYTQSGIYTQKFLTSFDCDSVHILDLRINKSTDIFFPNIISPDGINGFFTGYSQNTAMTIASLSVFDRWGQSPLP